MQASMNINEHIYLLNNPGHTMQLPTLYVPITKSRYDILGYIGEKQLYMCVKIRVQMLTNMSTFTL